MIRSMTAFARVAETSPHGSWVAEIRSLNNRYFDLSLRVPAFLNAFESEIREIIQSQIPRGKITFNLYKDTGEGEETQDVQLNEEAVKFYLDAARKIQKKYKIQDGIKVADLLRIPGILKAETAGEKPAKVWTYLQKLLKRTIEQAIRSKEVEGAKLVKDIEKRLQGITQAAGKIETISKGRSEVIYHKLRERIEGLLKESALQVDDRFYREVAFLAEKSDVTEELVRLKSHLELFRKKLKAASEVGRELDFLCQELNREINTIGSKSQLFEISTEVVFVKGELEKIREQVQNIE